MRKYGFIFFISFTLFISCSVHKITVPEQIGASLSERYDFNITKGGKEAKVILNRGWVTEWRPMTAEGGVCYEYAPAKEFYKIIKHYHRNGMIKMRGKILGSARFGIWEYFDEEGNRTQVVNEDAKFGTIGPCEIIKLLENEGWIDRRKGKNKIYLYHADLPTNGYFYKELEPNLRIIFRPACVENDKESRPPQWHIWLNLPGGYATHYIYEKVHIDYYVNGYTNEFEKKEKHISYYFFPNDTQVRNITYKEDTTSIVPETYDFISTRSGTQQVTQESNGWLIEKYPMTAEGAVYYEYAPAKEFHKQIKYFHPNGMIKERGKMIGSIRFGFWEYFDEQGNRTRIVDEGNRNYGNWLIYYLETEDWINLDTGETKILPYSSPLKTDGSFYKNLEPWLDVKVVGYELTGIDYITGYPYSYPITKDEIWLRKKRLQEKQDQEDILIKEMIEAGVPVVLEEQIENEERIVEVKGIDVKVALDGYDIYTNFESRTIRKNIKTEKRIRTDRLVSE